MTRRAPSVRASGSRRLAVVLGLLLLSAGGASIWWLAPGQRGDRSTLEPAPTPPVGGTGLSPAPEAAHDDALPVSAAALPDPLASGPMGGDGEPAVWRGRIVDVHGAPVPGARVWLVPAERELRARGLPEPQGASTGHGSTWRFDLPLDALRDATAGEDGRFELQDRHDTSELARRGAGQTLVVAAERFATRITRTPWPVLGLADVGDVCLAPELVVVGRIVGEDGEALPGAAVEAHHVFGAGDACGEPDERSVVGVVPALQSASADEQGRFTLRRLPVSPLVRLIVTSPGHVRRSVAWSIGYPPPPGQPFDAGDVVLSAGWRLQGTVVDASGSPLPGVTVFATHETRRHGGGCAVHERVDGDTIAGELSAGDEPTAAMTRSAGDGGFVLQGLPHPGAPSPWASPFPVSAADESVRAVTLYAHAPGHEPARRCDVRPDGGDVRLVLDGEATLRLHVVEDESGEPVRDAAVEAERVSGARWSRGVPLELSRAGDGVVRVHGVGTGGTRLVLTAPGRAPTRTDVPGVPAGEERDLTVRLPPGHVVRGRVVDSTGAPLAGVQIHGSSSAPPPRSAADGSFELRDLSPRRETLGFELDGYVPARASFVPDDEQLATVVLFRPSWLRGRVTDSFGRPLAGRVLRVKRRTELADEARDGAWLSTDADGCFASADIVPGSYNLLVRGGELTTIEVREGAVADVALTAAADGRVSGRVLRGGVPLAGAQITLSGTASTTAVTTDAYGRFELHVHEPGKGVLEVTTGERVVNDEPPLSIGWGDVVERDVHLP